MFAARAALDDSVEKRPYHEVRIAAEAFDDIAEIWDWTVERFGNAAAIRYETLITEAFSDLADNPQRKGVRARFDLLPSLWVFHLTSSSTNIRRDQVVKSPRHFILFRQVQPGVIEIVRVLHDSRDLARHLPKE